MNFEKVTQISKDPNNFTNQANYAMRPSSIISPNRTWQPPERGPIGGNDYPEWPGIRPRFPERGPIGGNDYPEWPRIRPSHPNPIYEPYDYPKGPGIQIPDKYNPFMIVYNYFFGENSDPEKKPDVNTDNSPKVETNNTNVDTEKKLVPENIRPRILDNFMMADKKG